MLGGAESQDELQLQDVMALHIIPLLLLPDIQALSKTCRVLREFIQSGLPKSAWEAAAANTVPAGHSLLKNAGTLEVADIRRHLQRQADAYSAIRQGRLRVMSQLTVAPRHAGTVDTVSVSPSGLLMITKASSKIVVSKLVRHEGTNSLTAVDAWTMPAPAAPPPWGKVDCEFVWAPCNRFVALRYNPHSGTTDDPTLHAMTTSNIAAWNVLYVLDIDIQQLQEVARTPPFTEWNRVLVMESVLFSYHSRTLVCCWSSDMSENTGGIEFIQVLKLQEDGSWPIATEMCFERAVAGHSICFSPDSAQVAFTRTTECAVYSIEGVLTATLACRLTELGTPQHVAWSPTGSHLACWCSKPAAISVFESHRWTQVATLEFPHIAHYTQGIIFGLRDLIHVSAAHDVNEYDRVTFCRLPEAGSADEALAGVDRISTEVLPFYLMRTTTDMFANEQPVFPETLPVFSPDGLFLALVDRAFCLHIVQCSSREVVFKQQLHIPDSLTPRNERNESVAQLMWMYCGDALFVVATIESEDPPLVCHLTMLEF